MLRPGNSAQAEAPIPHPDLLNPFLYFSSRILMGYSMDFMPQREMSDSAVDGSPARYRRSRSHQPEPMRQFRAVRDTRLFHNGEACPGWDACAGRRSRKTRRVR